MDDEASGALSRPQVVDQFPHAVREIEHLMIPLADGTRLAARIWLPESAEREPVPAILEYLPYRKRDGTSTRDALTHPYFAGHGYACVRVDMRGSGESDGLLDGEYLPAEQDDALEVVDWLTRQSWCSGRVGMIGISWGGFNGLQVAWRQPAALRAVITLCSTDDRYTDDIHYKGGTLLGENQGWGATMLAYQSRPPDPALVDDWRERWLARLEHLPLLVHEWLRHPHRDAFWRHGSVNEDYGRVGAAVLAVGGWGDGYSNAVPRLLRGLGGPTRAIIGPWVHKYPHFAVPEPAIGFLHEALRWWDRWLKDHDTGVEADPAVRVYVMDSVRPRGWYTHRAGAWYALPAWPDVDNGPVLGLPLARGRLGERAAPGETLDVCSPATVGKAAGEYCAIWLGPEMPVDQRLDDGGSLVFDSEPLDDAVTVAGAAVLDVRVSADRPVAQLAVRLNDVWPDGAATRITYAVLNLTHRAGHAEPRPLEPGEVYALRIQLDDVAYRVPAGHRLRLSVSSAYWPLAWPAPERATVCLHLQGAELRLPLLPAHAERVAPFGRATSAPPQAETELRAGGHERAVTTDLASGAETLRIVDDFGRRRIDAIGLETDTVARETYTVAPHDPASARCETHWTEVVARDGWEARTETFITQWCDANAFHLEARVEAFENDAACYSRQWRESVPRLLV